MYADTERLIIKWSNYNYILLHEACSAYKDRIVDNSQKNEFEEEFETHT